MCVAFLVANTVQVDCASIYVTSFLFVRDYLITVVKVCVYVFLGYVKRQQ